MMILQKLDFEKVEWAEEDYPVRDENNKYIKRIRSKD